MQHIELKKVQDLVGHTDRVWCVCWNPEGKILATCGGDRTVRLWDKDEQWVCKTILAGGHERAVRSVAWSTDGKLLASSGFDGNTCIWARENSQFEHTCTLEGHEHEVKSVAFSHTGRYLATCSRDKTVWIWERTEDDDFECISVKTSHTQDVKRVLWHPTKDILMSCSYDNTIRTYSDDGDDWELDDTLVGHCSTVWAASFEKSGERFVSSSGDNTLKVWGFVPKPEDSPIGTKDKWIALCSLSGYHERPIYDVAWCPLTGLIATACGDNGLRIFAEDLSSSTPEAPVFSLLQTVYDAHDGDVNCVAWHPTIRGCLASSGDDNVARIWQVVADWISDEKTNDS